VIYIAPKSQNRRESGRTNLARGSNPQPPPLPSQLAPCKATIYGLTRATDHPAKFDRMYLQWANVTA